MPAARDPHRERPLPQPEGRLLPHPARAADGRSRGLGLRQVDARLRHALRRGPAALRQPRSPPTRASSSSACRAPTWTRSRHLPPAIAIEQRNRVTNARSTVGTATEILDHLRLLFAKRRRDLRCCGRARRRRTPWSPSRGRAARSASRAPHRARRAAPAPARRTPRRAARPPRRARATARLLLPDGDAARRGGALAEGVRAAARRGAAADRPAGAGARRRTRAPRRGGRRAASRAAAGCCAWCPPRARAEEIREGFACDGAGAATARPSPRCSRSTSPLGACETCEGFGRIAGARPRARGARPGAHARGQGDRALRDARRRALPARSARAPAARGACRRTFPGAISRRRPARLRRRGRRRQVVRRARLLRVARGPPLQGAGARHDRALPALRSLPRLRRHAAARRGARGARRRAATSASSRASASTSSRAWLAGLALDGGQQRAGRARSGARCLERTRGRRCEVGLGYLGARPPGAHALGGRGAAHPARDRARRRAHRLALRARRAVDRAPRARRRAPARRAARASASAATPSWWSSTRRRSWARRTT